MNFSSKVFEEAVNHFEKLPGIGHRTAIRLVLHILEMDKESVEEFGNIFPKLRNNIKNCINCHNISETEICNICSNHKREKQVVCVVEDLRDVIAIENTNQYNGVYHVLGGIISPVEGVGPNQLNIDSLVARIKEEPINEVIFALSTTMEGDTTAFYIYKKIKESGVRITNIARGISVGGELEYTDEITLGRSIASRLLYENSFINKQS